MRSACGSQWGRLSRRCARVPHALRAHLQAGAPEARGRGAPLLGDLRCALWVGAGGARATSRMQVHCRLVPLLPALPHRLPPTTALTHSRNCLFSACTYWRNCATRCSASLGAMPALQVGRGWWCRAAVGVGSAGRVMEAAGVRRPLREQPALLAIQESGSGARGTGGEEQEREPRPAGAPARPTRPVRTVPALGCRGWAAARSGSSSGGGQQEMARRRCRPPQCPTSCSPPCFDRIAQPAIGLVAPMPGGAASSWTALPSWLVALQAAHLFPDSKTAV
jgi:hypothetical protein